MSTIGWATRMVGEDPRSPPDCSGWHVGPLEGVVPVVAPAEAGCSPGFHRDFHEHYIWEFV